MTNLAPNYRVTVDQVGKCEWSQVLARFDDANIYQTWSYGGVRWGEKNLSHITLEANGEVIAAAQVRIVKAQLVPGGIAYLAWGPLWRLQGREKDYDALRQVVSCLYEEYVVRRGLFLRCVSAENDLEPEAQRIREIFEGERFHWSPDSRQTLVLDLAPSLAELRQGFRDHWRRHLKKAEKFGFTFIEGTGLDLWESFAGLYEEMLQRKNFIPGADPYKFKEMQQDLPDALKMKVYLALLEGKVVSGLISSVLGNRSIFLFAASNDLGLKNNASYALVFRLIESLKQSNIRYLDQGGIDPQNNPGGYQFKRGVGGTETYSLGRFAACESGLSHSFTSILDFSRDTVWKTRLAINKIKHKYFSL